MKHQRSWAIGLTDAAYYIADLLQQEVINVQEFCAAFEALKREAK